MVWDGECNFCRMCAERFSSYKQQKVELVPYQELPSKYPQAPEKDYAAAVVLFTPAGNSYRAAAAVYRFYAEYPWRGWAFWAYQKFRWFSALSEWGYRLVANHRRIFRWLVTLFWGKSFALSSYRASGWVFGRMLGVTTLIAFLSLWVQSAGLIGPEGIVPFQENLDQVRDSSANGTSPWLLRPTLLWLISGTGGLSFLFTIGTLAALLLIIGFVPHFAVMTGWVCYLSVVVVAQPFLNFQWDLLLLETMFLSVFFLPWLIREKASAVSDPNCIGRWLLWLLLFKLMFESGVVKFTYFGAGGSNTWSDFTALDYHYWTQPIPSWFSWYFHWLPSWFHKMSLAITYVVELILPFFILLPRRFRNIACLGIVFLQLMIIITGNYGFFNLLAIILCLTLLDDQTIPDHFKRIMGGSSKDRPKFVWLRRWKSVLGTLVLVIFIITGGYYLSLDFRGNRPGAAEQRFSPSPVTKTLVRTAQFSRSMNSYGLFRVMTTTRPEIIISYSTDGKMWTPYQFNYKPVDLQVPSSFFFPHMPRLDWQMWFEALYIERIMDTPFSLLLYKRFLEVIITGKMKKGELRIEQFFTPSELQDLNTMDGEKQQQVIRNFQVHINSYLDHSYWFAKFLRALRQGNSNVLGLLADNSNLVEKPKNMRITFFYYNFSSPEEQKDGYWWSRKPLEQFSLDLSFAGKGE